MSDQERIGWLKEQWDKLWNNYRESYLKDISRYRKLLDDMFEELVRLYSNPNRRYHNIGHLEHCLREFYNSEFRNGPDLEFEFIDVEIAIWFHDAIYNSRAKDNEEKSAELAREFLTGIDYPYAKHIYYVILATKHDMRPGSLASQIMVDVDLSVLGLPQDLFDQYSEAIRQEYSWVPDEAFTTGRKKILQSFLDRPHIYCTDFFRKKYEASARVNLSRAIANLE